MLLAAPLATLTLVAAGCGGSSQPAPSSDPEQRAVTIANEICAEYLAFARAWSARSGPHPEGLALQRLAFVKRAAAARRQAALVAVAGLPRVRAYLGALAARERALLAVRRLAPRAGGPVPASAALTRAVATLDAAARRTSSAASSLGLHGCVGMPAPSPRSA
jgi:hypothetical protein